MKNIELVNLPQILGFLGVILSLGFVAFEINQNTNLSRNQAYLQFGESLKDITLELATDDLLPDLISQLRLGAGEDDFTGSENIRIWALQFATVKAWEGLYRSWTAGYLPSDTIVGIGGGHILNNNYFRQTTWPEIKTQQTPDFVSFFEDQSWNVEQN